MSLQTTEFGSSQLWLADLRSGRRHALTSGSTEVFSPAVSPDGSRLVFRESSGNYDVVSVDVASGATRKLIATERNEAMPAWAAAVPALVYVTDRNGSPEIWLRRDDGSDRPVVTRAAFPEGTTLWFMAPTLSPQCDRIAYLRIEGRESPGLWISGVAGGAPIQLTKDKVRKLPGSWSPDGAWFAYYAINDGKIDLMKVKTTGQATPVLLKANSGLKALPSWSPGSDWIANGTDLISSDGKHIRSLGEHQSPHYVFSRDGRSLYGVRSEQQRQVLFSIDVASGAERIISEVDGELRPASPLTPSIRFSLAPDGKSFVYGTGNVKTNMWLLEGLNPRRTLFDLWPWR